MLGSVVVGTWAGSLAGIGPNARAPVWLAVVLVAMVAVLFGVAAALTYRFSREAAAAGAPRAMAPVWISIAVGVLVILQNLAAYLVT
jgi:hypothetical protein